MAALLMASDRVSVADGIAAAAVLLVGVLTAGFAVAVAREFAIAVRYRLEADATGLAYRVPVRWTGLAPVPAFTSGRVGWADVAAVDRRDEVIRFLGVPTTLSAVSILLRGGERVELAKTKAGPDPVLPVADVADLLARNAGLRIGDRGMVPVPGLLAAARGAAAPWEGPHAPSPLADDEVHRTRGRELLWVKASGLVLSALVLLRACSQDW